MRTQCESASRTRIRAFRSGEHLLIVAEGEVPTPGYDVEIEQSPLRIFPPQFNLLRCRRPGIFPQIVTPYRHSETVMYPASQTEVTVNHADGADQVPIETCGEELGPYVRAIGAESACPDGADMATGFSKKLSIDEAFADAVAKLPALTPAHPDTLETVRVVETGALFGGIAGFHDLYIRICRTHD
jgi:hypothetical protein